LAGFHKISIVKFHRYASSMDRVHTCVPTDMTKVVDVFLDYVNEPIISSSLPSDAQQTLHLHHKGLSHYAA